MAYLSVLRQVNFFRYVLASLFYECGNLTLVTALSLYVLDKTGSSLAFGSMLSLGLLPKIILPLFTGVLADWLDKIKLLAVLNYVSASLLGLTILAMFYSNLELIVLFILVVVLGVVAAFYNPAGAGLTRFLVTNDQLPDAYAVNSFIDSLQNLVIPILAAALYSMLSIRLMLIIVGVLFFCAAVLIGQIKLKTTNKLNNRKKLGKRYKDDLLSGFAYLKTNLSLCLIAGTLLVFNFFAIPIFTVGAGYFLKVYLGLSNTLFAMVESVATIASLASTLLLTPLVKQIKSERLLVYVMLLSAFGLLVIATTSQFSLDTMQIYWLYLACFAAICMIEVPFNISVMVALQRMVDKAYLGRINGMLTLLFMGAAPLGQLVYGQLYKTLPIAYPYVISAVAYVIIALVYHILAKRMQNTSKLGIVQRRQPHLSLVDYRQLKGDVDLQRYLNRSDVRELLLTSNFILFSKLLSKKTFTQKEKNTLYSYLSRLMSRATPFGFLSEVTVVDDSKEELPNQKVINLDRQWLFKLTMRLNKETDLLSHQRFQIQSQVYKKGGRYYLRTVKGVQSIQASPIIERIMTLSEQPITLKKMVSILVEEQGVTYESDKIKAVLVRLHQLGYLIAEFDELPGNITSLVRLANLVSSPINTQLRGLVSKLITYQSLSLGSGIDDYKAILILMAELCPSEHYLNVSRVGLTKGHTLAISDEHYQDFADSVIFLTKVAQSLDQVPSYQSAINRFIEKFGYASKIPLAYLFDSILGIGDFESDPKPGVSKFELYLKDQFAEALSHGGKSIDISTYQQQCELKAISRGSEYEIYLRVLQKGKQHTIQYLPYTGADRIGKSNYRFTGSIKSDDRSLIWLDELLAHKPYMNIAEGSHSEGDELNTLKVTKQRTVPGDIGIENVNVGVQNVEGRDQFYFTLGDSTRPVVFDIKSMLNYHVEGLFSKESRFLLEASRRVVTPFDTLNCISKVEVGVYKPAVYYQQIQLYPASWLISKERLHGISMTDAIMRYKIDRFVFLQDDDQYLLLDLTYTWSQAILIARYEKGESLLLLSAQEVHKADQLLEVVVPWYSESEISTPEEIIAHQYDYDSYIRVAKEWLYIKLYPIGKDLTSLLLAIQQFIFDLERELGEKIQFFYVNYSDQYQHIRLRIRTTSTNQVFLLKRLVKFADGLSKQQLIFKHSYHQYIRELERYGGEDKIAQIERLFDQDSRLVLESLQSSKTDFDKLLSLRTFFSMLVISYQDQVVLFEKFEVDEQVRKAYQAIRKAHKVLYPSLSVVVEENLNPFSLSRDQIESLCHMHCNRLLLSSEQERQLMMMYQCFLHDLRYFNERYQTTI